MRGDILKSASQTVCHISSVHRRDDTRIYFRQCRSLINSGYTVYAIVADSKGSGPSHGINYVDVGKPRNRLLRIAITPILVLRSALKIKAQVYHIHDPELIPMALVLRATGRKVIYDVHEDYPKEILSKSWLLPIARRPVAWLTYWIERIASKHLSHIVAATKATAERFIGWGRPTAVVGNYPWPNELSFSSEPPIVASSRSVCYIGNITAIRGIRELVMAIEGTDLDLHLAGTFDSEILRSEVTQLPGWKNVKEYGQVTRDEAREILGASCAGIALLHPTPAHLEAWPNKIFEYMSAGRAVICSDFPHWKTLIETHRAGVCVNPLDPEAIRRALVLISQNMEETQAMGQRGRELVQNQFSWSREEKSLLEVYGKVLEL